MTDIPDELVDRAVDYWDVDSDHLTAQEHNSRAMLLARYLANRPELPRWKRLLRWFARNPRRP